MEADFAQRIRVIESILEAYERRDVSEMVDGVTKDVEWCPLMTAAEGRSFRGPEGIRQWYSELMETFDEVAASVEDHRPIGSRVLTSGRLRASGRASGAVVDQAVTWLWDFRGDAVRRMEAFTDSDEALAAAGEDVDASDN
jgi:ketosteroid isomerase-like protein